MLGYERNASSCVSSEAGEVLQGEQMKGSWRAGEPLPPLRAE